MEKEPDPLAIDELIRQARELKAKWRPPDPDTDHPWSHKPWLQLMEDRKVKTSSWG